MPQTIKPATPLPWSASDYHEMGGYDCMTGSITVGRAELDGNRYGQIACEQITAEQLAAITQDAAYIVEAANAYPRLMAERAELVAALREFVAWVDSTAHGIPDERTLSRAVTKSRALLRRIGGE